MHQWPSEVFQVGVLALPFFLEIKHNFPQYCTCRSENLTHNSSYRWPLEYFRAYDKKWHQTLESALLTSLYANFAGGNVYIFRVDVYGCTEIKPVQSLMRCKVTWAICVILYSLQEISNEILPPSKLQNSRWVTKRVMSNTFFEKFCFSFFFNFFSKTCLLYRAEMFRDHCCYALFNISIFHILRVLNSSYSLAYVIRYSTILKAGTKNLCHNCVSYIPKLISVCLASM